MMFVGVLTDPGAGGTFLTWTLHYLSGASNYFCANENKIVNVPHSPLTANNAHNFVANQPITFNDFTKMIGRIQETKLIDLHTIYFHNFRSNEINSTKEDTNEAVLHLEKLTNKIVVLTVSKSHSLYFSKFESRVLHRKFNLKNVLNEDFVDQHNDFIDTFFYESKQKWKELGLTNTWDYREFLALNTRPHHTESILPNINLSKPHYLLESFDLYNQFETTVVSLFCYLGLDIDPTRWQNWTTVYKQWQAIHRDRILFVEYFDTIINSIINNYYLDLERFNLDLIREATILHELLYKHNLSIRGWGLEKFPANTQDLHNLLEKNTFHKIENIYGVL